MAIVVAVFQAMMGAMMPFPESAVKPAMVAPADAIPMGPGMPVLNPIVAAVMALLEAIMLAIVLATMVIARSVLRRRRRRHANRNR